MVGLWYEDADAALGYAKFYSRSHNAVIRVYDESGKVIETHQHAGEFKEPQAALSTSIKKAV